MDGETYAKIAAAERENTRYAMLWRALMVNEEEEPSTPAEHLRRTAKGAVEDWLERKADDERTKDPG